MQYAIFPHDFAKFPQNVHNILTLYPNSKTYVCITIHQNEIFFFAFGRALRDRLRTDTTGCGAFFCVFVFVFVYLYFSTYIEIFQYHF